MFDVVEYARQRNETLKLSGLDNSHFEFVPFSTVGTVIPYACMHAFDIVIV